MTGDTIDPASEVVLIDNVSSVNGNHNGGDLFVGGDIVDRLVPSAIDGNAKADFHRAGASELLLNLLQD